MSGTDSFWPNDGEGTYRDPGKADEAGEANNAGQEAAPSRNDYGCCDPVLSDQWLVDTLTEIMLKAEVDALSEKDGTSVPSHAGLRAHLLRPMYGTPRLRERNWTREDVQGQVRFVNRTEYPFPVRLIPSSGEFVDGSYVVCPKGPNTREAAWENEQWLSSPLQPAIPGLIDDSDTRSFTPDEAIQTYFVCVHSQDIPTGGWWITIRMGLVHSLNDSGTRMHVLQDRVMFAEAVPSAVASLHQELPPAEQADVHVDALFADIQETEDVEMDPQDQPEP